MRTRINTWEIPREAAVWVGPIDCVLSVDGVVAPVVVGVEFAVLPAGQRPIEADWAAPYLDPDGSGALGVFQNPVLEYVRLGIWARRLGSPEDPVLDPPSVGWIVRT